MSTPSTEPSGLSWVGKVLMIYFSVLFGVEIIMPWVLSFLTVLGFPSTTNPGDANTKAVLANLVIALWAYLLGRNEGSRQADNTISKLVESNKKAQEVIAANAPAITQLDPGQVVQAPAEVPRETSPEGEAP